MNNLPVAPLCENMTPATKP